MPNGYRRLIAFLLASCLIADPATACALGQGIPFWPTAYEGRGPDPFTAQAVVEPLLDFLQATAIAPKALTNRMLGMWHSSHFHRQVLFFGSLGALTHRARFALRGLSIDVFWPNPPARQYQPFSRTLLRSPNPDSNLLFMDDIAPGRGGFSPKPTGRKRFTPGLNALTQPELMNFLRRADPMDFLRLGLTVAQTKTILKFRDNEGFTSENSINLILKRIQPRSTASKLESRLLNASAELIKITPRETTARVLNELNQANAATLAAWLQYCYQQQNVVPDEGLTPRLDSLVESVLTIRARIKYSNVQPLENLFDLAARGWLNGWEVENLLNLFASDPRKAESLKSSQADWLPPSMTRQWAFVRQASTLDLMRIGLRYPDANAITTTREQQDDFKNYHHHYEILYLLPKKTAIALDAALHHRYFNEVYNATSEEERRAFKIFDEATEDQLKDWIGNALMANRQDWRKDSDRLVKRLLTYRKSIARGSEPAPTTLAEVGANSLTSPSVFIKLSNQLLRAATAAINSERAEAEGPARDVRRRFRRYIAMARAAEEKAPDEDAYFMPVFIADEGTNIQPGDSLAFVNFRGDRADPLFRLLTDWNQFKHWVLAKLKLQVLPFGNYNNEYLRELGVEPVLVEESHPHTLGEVWYNAGLTQLRSAESEKFKHVTYFFDGLRDLSKKLDPKRFITRMIKSNKIENHYEMPKMKAQEIADEDIKYILGEGVPKVDVGVINFANSDIVGHSHVSHFEDVVEAVSEVDRQVARVWGAIQKVDGILIITADHGSSEEMAKLTDQGTLKRDAKGRIIANKAHAFDNPVDFIVLGHGANRITLKNGGSLKNLAPTLLQLQGIDKPAEMTAESRVEGTESGQFKGRPLFIVVRDGQGINKWRNPEQYPEAFIYDAVHQARSRNGGQLLVDDLVSTVPSARTELAAHGAEVGHPPYQMGDSETGHRNMGEGREFLTPLSQINRLLEQPDFAQKSSVRALLDNASQAGKRLHLWGMISPGGVHSHTDHFLKFMDVVAKVPGIGDIILHPVFDGRDTDTPGWESLQVILDHALDLGLNFARRVKVGVVAGRYYPMDRDGLNNDLGGGDGSALWKERSFPAYDALVHGLGPAQRSSQRVLSGESA